MSVEHSKIDKIHNTVSFVLIGRNYVFKSLLFGSGKNFI